MITIPTAENFIINKLDETQPNENRPQTPKQVEEWMIEFAKMHVTKALKCAAKASESFDFSGDEDLFQMNQVNVLTAYNLDNIE